MNQKGGVGKTTSTVNLGAALARAGRRTLLIDLDPQAHLTMHVGVDPGQLDLSVYDLLTDDDVTVGDVIQPVEGNKNLFIIPADVNLAGVEAELAPKMITGVAQRVLERKCESLMGSGVGSRGSGVGVGGSSKICDPQPATRNPKPEFILIDCPPSLGLLTINALTLAREVLVPMQAHFLALQGFGMLMETVQLVRQAFNPQLLVSGVMLCMHENQTLLAQEVMAELTGFLDKARGTDLPWRDAKVLSPPVRRNIKLAECPSFGKTVFDYAPDCHGARDYARLAEALAAMNNGATSSPDAQAEAEPPTVAAEHMSGPPPVEIVTTSAAPHAART
jgi:chromosome partitioning protein